MLRKLLRRSVSETDSFHVNTVAFDKIKLYMYSDQHDNIFVILMATSVGLFVCFWLGSPHWAMASSFTGFLDHTQRRTTVGRTPLDE